MLHVGNSPTSQSQTHNYDSPPKRIMCLSFNLRDEFHRKQNFSGYSRKYSIIFLLDKLPVGSAAGV